MSTHPAPIKDVLNKITTAKTKLFLSQTYKGFLFTEPVKVEKSDSDRILLLVNAKVFSFCHSKDAILHDQLLNAKIAGQVVSFNLQSGLLIFQNIQPRKDPWVDRREVRIQPQHPLVGVLRTRGETFRGCINDLSRQGAGFLLHVSEISDKLPKVGQAINLFFTLPNDVELLIPGKIGNITTLSHQLFGIGIKLDSDEKQQVILSRYLQMSYQNMLEQIDEDYRKLLEPWAAFDLYF